MTLTLAVCLKPTWRTDTVVRLSESGKSVRADGAAPGLSTLDAGVLAQALALKTSLESAGGSIRLQALTVGPPSALPLLREALAAGVDESIRVWTSGSTSDTPGELDGSATSTWRCAGLVAQAMRPAKTSGPLLVLAGESSSDEGHGSFGAFVAQALGVDFAHRTTSLAATGSGWLAHVKLERGYTQELELEASAVVTMANQGLKLADASWPTWLASRTESIPTLTVDYAEGAIPVPASVTVLRPPVPRVKRYRVPSSSLPAEARIRSLVGEKPQGGGQVFPASGGLDRQVEAVISLLKSRGFHAGKRI